MSDENEIELEVEDDNLPDTSYNEDDSNELISNTNSNAINDEENGAQYNESEEQAKEETVVSDNSGKEEVEEHNNDGENEAAEVNNNNGKEEVEVELEDAQSAASSSSKPVLHFLTSLLQSPNCPYPSYEKLHAHEANALLYLGGKVSDQASFLKGQYRQRKTEVNLSINQMIAIFLSFHRLAIAKLELCAALSPAKTFHRIVATSTYSLPPSNNAVQPTTEEYPEIDIAMTWANAAFRYGKALEKHRDMQEAAEQLTISAKLMQWLMNADTEHKYTLKVLTKLPKVIEKLAMVQPSNSEVGDFCDYFLVQFSNIAMRGEVEQLSLQPLASLVLSDCRYIKACNPIEVVRHLATFFKSSIASEANNQLEHLESLMKNTKQNEEKISKLPDSAKKRLDSSGLTKEEQLENTDILLNLINWKGRPPCRLHFDPIPLKEGDEENIITWKNEDPRKNFIDRCRMSADDDNPKALIYLARRKTDNVSVAAKVFKKYPTIMKQVDNEIKWLQSLRHDVFSKILDIYKWGNELWVIMEHCDAGNLVDIMSIETMEEGTIAFIAREVLKGLEYLHTNNRMHRDLTSDDILLTLDGEVILADFEIWLTDETQRYWLAPELLLQEPFPYGSEVDIWALGCICMEMADGKQPYADLHPLKEFYYTATKGAPPLQATRKWSKSFKHFLSCALHPDPNKRYTATQLLQHPFIGLASNKEEFSQAIKFRVSWTRW